MFPRRSVLLFLVFAYHFVSGFSLPASSYDQRQTGDLNVQVHLKDVQVLALLDTELLDDYTEYDYFYDYADFTVKPSVKPTTSTATTTTTTDETPSSLETTQNVQDSESSESPAQNSTSSLNVESSNANSTLVEDFEVASPVTAEKNETLAVVTGENSSNEDDTLKRRINDKNLFEEKGNGGSTEHLSKRVTRRRCRSGYSPDGKGRCRRLSQRRLSLIPLAMRLAPKLLDDLARSSLATKEVDQMHSNRAVP